MKNITPYILLICFAAITTSIAMATQSTTDTELQCSGISCSRLNKSCNAQALLTSISKSTTMLGRNKIMTSGINWQEYSSATLAQAKQTHHLVILFSKSEQCPWSQKMEKTTFSDTRVTTLINNKFVPAYIDFYKNNNIAEQYKIVNLPTTIILDTNGQVLKELSGYISADEMERYLDETETGSKNI